MKTITSIIMLLAIFGAIMLITSAGAQEKPPYLNTSLSYEERAADLVSRMTLEEKVSQIGNKVPGIPRLGVSEYNYWREGLHGVARQGKATSFPTSLSMSNTWNRRLIYAAADITSTEARGKNSKYNLSYWSPTVNLARDPRWGRTEETYGEDPYLTGELGIEFVRGMQGDDQKYLKTIATLKHFLANNCEAERRMGTSVMDERTLREYYAKVFQNIVEKAHPASVMSSYNATTVTRNGMTLYDYIPSAANPYTLIDLLRRNWGFSGYVTGDCGAVVDLHRIPAYKQALFPGKDINQIPQSATIAKSIQAGNDLDCGSAAQPNAYEAVKKGYMSEADLDIAVYRLFLQRMRTGEFDNNVKYSGITSNVLEAPKHVEVAERAAEESWVLLKNQGHILPLASTVKNIALVGSLADQVVLGDYSGTPDTTITPYAGLKEELAKVNPGAKVNYLRSITSTTPLFNIKSLTLILSDGSTRTVDLSKAGTVKNKASMPLSGKSFVHVTCNAAAVVKGVDFSNVVSVNAEMSTGASSPGGVLELAYGKGGPIVASIPSVPTADVNTYVECKAEYKGASGGYDKTADLYLSVKANDFSIEKYKQQLDDADVIIAYAGTDLSDSSESNDRISIKLPDSQSHVDAITAAYPGKTVVVMQTVGQIDVSSFIGNSKAVLWTSYNGQTQGKALAKILTGQVNPSGKLTTTWYAPADLNVMTVNTTEVIGKDGLSRYYNNYNIRSKAGFPGRTYQYYSGKAAFSFGFGLSYTDYAYSNIKVSSKTVDANGKITVTADVKNTGGRDGSEAVQLYVVAPGADGINRPLKQLKGFEKISLKAGETKTVSFDLAITDINFFDEASRKIYVPTGTYTVMIGKNSQDADALTAQFTVTGSLNPTLKTVKAMPTGLSVDGANWIDARLSAVMTDEAIYDLKKAKVTYTSADTNVAKVDATGKVTAGSKPGVTTIRASVTIDGVTKTDSFPVVSKIADK